MFESENFVVVPTVGSIVPGWVLVVPRSHFLSVGYFDETLLREFIRIQNTAVKALQECFGPVSIFEHGAVRERESVGCGVDHAHLHIVATEHDLMSGVKVSGANKLQWRRAAGIQAARSCVSEQMPYIFVQPPSGGAWIGSAEAIESQLMRKVVAAQTGQLDCWDWKAYPFSNNVRETVEKLEAWKSANAMMPSIV